MGWQTLYENLWDEGHHSIELWVDFKLIVTDLTLPISTAFDQAASWPRWQDPTCRENLPPRLRAADVPFGMQTNKKKKKKKVFLLAPAGPPIQLLPFRPFGFSFLQPLWHWLTWIERSPIRGLGTTWTCTHPPPSKPRLLLGAPGGNAHCLKS